MLIALMKIFNEAACDKLADKIEIETIYELTLLPISRVVKSFAEKRRDTRKPMAETWGKEILGIDYVPVADD